uniref:Uncharacterized protein n=1 Tax=Triticum urartu TaxID=4572 RepID=A0A8R7QM58_TRIUA
IHSAGHMVPMDQPKAALEMLRKLNEEVPEEEPATMFYAAV